MSSDQQLSAALIIPALDEAEVIGATLSSIPPGVFATIIVADNGSTDSTSEIAGRYGAMVVRERQRGYGAACLTAVGAVPAGTTAVVFMQADASEDPAQAVELLTPIYDGRADLVIGSRTLGSAERGALLPHQRFGNAVAGALIHLLLGHRFTDLGPFRAIRLSSLRELEMEDRNYGWTVEMQVKALRGGLRVMEVPVTYRKRLAGQNKVSGTFRSSVRAGAKILWTILRLSKGFYRPATGTGRNTASARR